MLDRKDFTRLLLRPAETDSDPIAHQPSVPEEDSGTLLALVRTESDSMDPTFPDSQVPDRRHGKSGKDC